MTCCESQIVRTEFTMYASTYSAGNSGHAGTPLFLGVFAAIVDDMKTIDELRELPDDPRGMGVYFLWYKGDLTYIGFSTDINRRLYMHHCAWRYKSPGNRVCIPHDRATAVPCDTVAELRPLEKAYIRLYTPPFNKQSNPKCS